MEPGQIFHDMVHGGGKEERETVITQEILKYTHTHTHTHLQTDIPFL